MRRSSETKGLPADPRGSAPPNEYPAVGGTFREPSTRRMISIVHRVADEISKTQHNPRRLLKLWRIAGAKVIVDSIRQPGSWSPYGNGLWVRRYPTYQRYLQHQRWKPHRSIPVDHEERFRGSLSERLRRQQPVGPGMSVLCLGARWGTEVRAFADVGCFAVGVDVKPGKGDDLVLRGDFQKLQFSNACVDVIYTNSLDHATEIDRVLNEVRRTLKASGILIIEAVLGSRQGHPPGVYESFYWSTTDDLLDLVVAHGFVLQERYPIEEPWPGEHFRFVRGN